jgi:hypothetical protein
LFDFRLAVAIERIIYLNLSTTNSKKSCCMVKKPKSGGIELQKDVCRNTSDQLFPSTIKVSIEQMKALKLQKSS